MAPPPTFEEQLAEHRPFLLAMAFTLAGSEAQAHDLVQDTFVRALERRHTCSPGTALRAWLVTILHHRFIDLCRRQKTRGTRPLDEAVLELPAPEPEAPPAWAQVDGEAVRAAAARLPAEMRAVFELHAQHGLPYAEIARRLGVPQNTVGTRLLRARRKLRDLLGGGIR